MEYLYIPLGGNRKGRTRTYINLMLTMLIGGLWHGASWTFVAWGALHGLALCVHKWYAKTLGTRLRIPGAVCVVMNTAFVCLCWVFFRATTFSGALAVLQKLFCISGGIRQVYSWLVFALAVEVIYVLWCRRVSRVRRAEDSRYPVNAFYFCHNLNTVKGLTLFFLEIMAIVGLAYTAASPFIYFQF